jgi:hypothetical protein
MASANENVTEPEIEKVVAEMYAEARAYSCVSSGWYVWVSKSGFVSMQDGTPMREDRERFYVIDVSTVRNGRGELPGYEAEELSRFLYE